MRDEPVWRLLILGWLVGQGLAGGAAGPPFGASPPDFTQLEHGPSPRELRSWPGIGETRALAIAEARWEHPANGPPLYLGDVHGIGPRTERAVRAWMDAR